MANKRKAGKKSHGSQPVPSEPTNHVAAGLMALGGALFIAILVASGKIARPGPAAPQNAHHDPTFNKDIASVVYQRCASCHRPGQAAPFALLTFQDVKKHLSEVSEAIHKGLMPPWLPEPGPYPFVGDRSLSREELELIEAWIAAGAPEGAASDLPPAPVWAEGWTLGKPDLVAMMPEPYTLAAEGEDVYRHFVISLPITQRKYVRAVEFNPGNWKAVHHAFVKFDNTPQSRTKDAEDAEIGFPGMGPATTAAAGHFRSWQPGKVPSAPPEEFAWPLEKSTDLVLELHLRKTGKPEKVQPSVAFYFTDQPPTRRYAKVELNSQEIDIAAGRPDFTVTDEFAVPVDVYLNAILPHAHYRGKEVEAWATLPGREKTSLLHIKNWDFDWQGDYRYAAPVFLPKGTRLSMAWRFDNSTNNIHNPFNPPKRAVYGLQSSDEMAEVWFQLMAADERNISHLIQACENKVAENYIAHLQRRVELNPKDSDSQKSLGGFLFARKDYKRASEHLQTAAEVDPSLDEPHYYLGVMARLANDLKSAKQQFETAIRLNPRNYKAHGNLGIILFDEGNVAAAEAEFRAALKIYPEDDVSLDFLKELANARKPGVRK